MGNLLQLMSKGGLIMLTIFLTIIAGIIAVSWVSSIILTVLVIRKNDKDRQAYEKRVENALARLNSKGV